MICRTTKTWLLQSETMKPTAWPKEVAEHVAACAACAKVARRVRQIENQWRDELPIADETAPAMAVFLTKLREIKSAVQPSTGSDFELVVAEAPKKKSSARRYLLPISWAAAAAVLLIGGSGFVYLAFTPAEIQASSDVVDRLIDLNLRISNADSKERKRLYEEQKDPLRKDLEKAKLTADEQAFARELLDTCAFLSENDDVIEEMNAMTELADKIKSREEMATRKGNHKERDQCNFQHMKVMQMGYSPIIERIAEFKTPEGSTKPGYDSFMKYDKSKQQQLQKALVDYGKSGRLQADLQKGLEALRKKTGSGKSGGFGPSFKGFKK